MKETILSNRLIHDELVPYGVAADEGLCESVKVYIGTLLQWNAKIALTTITDPVEILRVHFGESFFAAEAAGIGKGRLADIGTGAGFPGIPIRMVRDGIQLRLVESVAKKTAFLGEIVRKLNLAGVEIIRYRMEDWSAEPRSLDFVTARALGRYDELLHWSKTRLSQDGKVVLLLGEAEVARICRELGWKWQEAVKVPQSRNRFVLLGSPAE
jgi:16S rRNA (guanine527-N7)-methyltransferase